MMLKVITGLCLLFVSSSLLADPMEIEVQALFADKAVVLIDGQRHLLSRGQTSPQGVKMISGDSRGVVLEVDGRQRKYALGNRVSTVFAKKKKNREQIVANKQGMFFSHGSINGQPVRFLVDTGATTVAISARLAKKLGISYRIHGRETRASTASGVARAWSVKLKSVTLGSIRQRNVDAMVVEGDYPRHALLGMSFLDRLQVKKSANLLSLEQLY